MRVRQAAAALLAALSVAVPAAAQTLAPAPPRAPSSDDFPFARWTPIADAASYLAVYDRVAWVTSDSMMALVAKDSTLGGKLGREWFAFQQDSTWHAVYGRFDRAADRYVQVAHFAGVRGHFHRERTPADSLLARRYGRALAQTEDLLPAAAKQSGARFNAFARPVAAGGLEIWYLPAWQTNGWIIHGMEFYFRVDSSGRAIVDSSSVVGPLQGSPPDSSRVIRIANESRELPTVGQAFFAYYYGHYFKGVYIVSRDFVSTFASTPTERTWVHAVRPELDSGRTKADSAR